MCIALRSSEDLADWVDADCYETRGYICKIEGKLLEEFGGVMVKWLVSLVNLLTYVNNDLYLKLNVDCSFSHI